MDLNKLQSKLLAAARATPPGEGVPYAFEKRVMAGLAAVPGVDEWLWWTRALWRGAATCAAVTLLVSAWSLLPLSNHGTLKGGADLEETVLASVDDAEVTW
jgi:hypothetical protein